MLAHRIKVTIPESRELWIALPEETPAGEAEVIVLYSLVEPQAGAGLTFEQRFPPNVRLRGIVFNEDPTASLAEEG